MRTNDENACKRMYCTWHLGSSDFYVCSYCSYDASNDVWNYCPNCGRRYTNTVKEAREEMLGTMSEGAKRIFDRLMESLNNYEPSFEGDK